MNPVADAAVKRGAILGVATFAASFGSGLMLIDQPIRYVIGAAMFAAAGAFGTRAIGEGWYDVKRATDGNLNKGDVAAASPKLQVVSKDTGKVIG